MYVLERENYTFLSYDVPPPPHPLTPSPSLRETAWFQEDLPTNLFLDADDLPKSYDDAIISEICEACPSCSISSLYLFSLFRCHTSNTPPPYPFFISFAVVSYTSTDSLFSSRMTYRCLTYIHM